MGVIVSFWISLLGIGILLTLKSRKATLNSTLYLGVRGHLDHYALRFSYFLKSVPHESRRIITFLAHAVIFRVSEAGLHAVRFLERRLFKFVNMIKGKGEVNRKRGSASLFLSAIREEKKPPLSNN